jgi:hypothetical protein
MPGLVALPNAARALFRPARPGGQPVEARRGVPCPLGFWRPAQNGPKWRRKSLERLDSRPEMAPPLLRVTPAKAGVQVASYRLPQRDSRVTPMSAAVCWTPVFTGVTRELTPAA